MDSVNADPKMEVGSFQRMRLVIVADQRGLPDAFYLDQELYVVCPFDPPSGLSPKFAEPKTRDGLKTAERCDEQSGKGTVFALLCVSSSTLTCIRAPSCS